MHTSLRVVEKVGCTYFLKESVAWISFEECIYNLCTCIWIMLEMEFILMFC